MEDHAVPLQQKAQALVDVVVVPHAVVQQSSAVANQFEQGVAVLAVREHPMPAQQVGVVGRSDRVLMPTQEVKSNDGRRLELYPAAGLMEVSKV